MYVVPSCNQPFISFLQKGATYDRPTTVNYQYIVRSQTDALCSRPPPSFFSIFPFVCGLRRQLLLHHLHELFNLTTGAKLHDCTACLERGLSGDPHQPQVHLGVLVRPSAPGKILAVFVVHDDKNLENAFDNTLPLSGILGMYENACIPCIWRVLAFGGPHDVERGRVEGPRWSPKVVVRAIDCRPPSAGQTQGPQGVSFYVSISPL